MSGKAGADALNVWVKAQLQSLLGFPDDGALTAHLLSFPSRAQLIEYCKEVLGGGNKVEQFAVELWRRKGGAGPTSAAASSASSSAGSSAAGDLYASRNAADTSSAALKAKHTAAPSASSSSSSSSSAAGGYSAHPSSSAALPVDLGLGRNVKVKYTSANKGAGAQPSKSQRTLCPCQATTHPLFGSCTACGKIVCAAEGEGSCFFCGSYVHQGGAFASEQFKHHMRERARRVPQNTEQMLREADEAAELNAAAGAAGEDAAAAVAPVSGSAVSAADNGDEEKKESSSGASSSSATAAAAVAAEAAGLAKAEAQRNKLLSFAREKGTKEKIHDTDNDWYSFESDAWLSDEARAAKKAATEQALLDLDRRRAHTLTIDLAGKSVVHHSSDAWTESVDNQQRDALPKWTDEAPSADVSAAASAAPRVHGEAMAAAMGGSAQLRSAVEEMKIVSRKQYYSNDTLTGRAREVYLALKEALAPKPKNNHVAGAGERSMLPSSAEVAAAGQSNSLLSSLAKPKPGGSRILDDDDDDDETTNDDGVNDQILASRLNKLELEAAPWRRAGRESAAAAAAAASSTSNSSTAACAAPSCGGGDNDEDEPSCGAAPSSLDAAFTDLGDRGVCLSMWQPWASLLVAGIKTFEGRGWFASHRGRLWIASGSREVDPAEVAQVEQEYRDVYGPQAKIPFPASYPTSALLGCVDMTACWSAEEFQQHRAESMQPGSAEPPILEDNASAFVFVCRNPRLLPVAQSISGAHKLWTLPGKLVQGLQATLVLVSESWKPNVQRAVSAVGAAPSNKKAPGGGLDLWSARARPSPSPSPSAALASLESSRPASVSSLAPGVVLLRHALPLVAQQALLDAARHAASLSEPFAPTPGASACLSVSLGLAWHAGNQRWEPRTERGRPVQPLAPFMLAVCQRVLGQAAEYFASHGGGVGAGRGGALPLYTSDLCELRYCPPGVTPAASTAATAEALQSFERESEESRSKGFPVVLLSLGDNSELAYAVPAAAGDEQGPRARVSLSSGDAVTFGGSTPATAPARATAMAIERVQAQSKPKELFMTKGTLYLLFRKR